MLGRGEARDPDASAADAPALLELVARAKARIPWPGWIKAKGKTAEIATGLELTGRGWGVGDLNRMPNVSADNFPHVDFVWGPGAAAGRDTRARVPVAGEPGGGFGSVKAKTGLRATQRYVRDLVNLRNADRARRAAEKLLAPDNEAAIRELQDRGAWPEGLNPTVDDVAELMSKAVLVIPDDHVPAVQEALRVQVLRHPENYGLPSGVTPSEQDIAREVNRITGCGLRSEQIEFLATAPTSAPAVDDAPHVLDISQIGHWADVPGANQEVNDRARGLGHGPKTAADGVEDAPGGSRLTPSGNGPSAGVGSDAVVEPPELVDHGQQPAMEAGEEVPDPETPETSRLPPGGKDQGMEAGSRPGGSPSPLGEGVRGPAPVAPAGGESRERVDEAAQALDGGPEPTADGPDANGDGEASANRPGADPRAALHPQGAASTGRTPDEPTDLEDVDEGIHEIDDWDDDIGF